MAEKGDGEKDDAKKLKTGIAGLDEILKGGINKASSVLIMGAPGTGKTIMAIQFIYEGAKKGEPGLYIVCEETIDDIKNYAKNLGMNFDELEKKGLITFVRQPITTRKLASISLPLELIRDKKVKRVALDSLTFFEYTHVAGPMDYRKEVLDFIEAMREEGVTLFVISEHPNSEVDSYTHKAEDFLFEGLIMMMMVRRTSSFERCVRVIKMRGQEHLIDIYPFTIERGGIKIFPDQIPFSLVDKESGKAKK